MPKLILSCRRFDSDIEKGHADECQFQLITVGQMYPDGQVTLLYGDIEIASCAHLEFHKLAEILHGKGVSSWETILSNAALPGVNEQLLKTFKATTSLDINLFKSALLIYRLIDLHLFRPERIQPQKILYDQPLLDVAGEPMKNVPVLYFPPKSYYEEVSEESLKTLYDLNLLARAELEYGDERLRRVFKPLRTPGIAVSKFDPKSKTGGPNRLAWQRLLEYLHADLSKRFGHDG